MECVSIHILYSIFYGMEIILIKREIKLVELLKEKQLIITTAESCTAGLVSAAIVNVSGASTVFKEGYITYCDESKHRLLGVSQDTLNKYKAVSAETAMEMAKGAADKARADIGISVTGVAGPDTEDGKPVGLVYTGIYYYNNGVIVNKAYEHNLKGDRQQIRNQAVECAIDMVIDVIDDSNIDFK